MASSTAANWSRRSRDKLVFGDITTGRIWYANRAEVLAADDDNPTTVAPINEMDAGLRRLTEGAYRARGGKGEAMPGMGALAGRGRVNRGSRSTTTASSTS